MHGLINNTVLELISSDITKMETDAIVNPANTNLQHGGGVAGAIVHKGGRSIQMESNRIGSCPVGQAVITGSGRLKAKFVIHAVGPHMGEGDEGNKLRSATLSSLKLADDNVLQSIAFPAVSTGIFGYPIARCARVMLSATINYLRGDTGLKKVVFCLYGEADLAVFSRELQNQIPDLGSD